MPTLPILGPTYTTRSSQVHGEECVNYYPEVITRETSSIGEQPPTSVVLYCTPGTVAQCDLSESSVRGMFSYLGFIYAAAGQHLYKVTQDSEDGVSLSAVLIGTFTAGDTTGPVHFLTNGSLGGQFLVTTSQDKYVYTIAAVTLGPITDPLSLHVLRPAYQDGYGILPGIGGTVWGVTNLLDFSTIDALSFAQTTTKPDTLIAAATLQQYVFLFGQYGVEIWYNSGSTALDGTASTFAFSKVTQSYIEKGTIAPFSIVSADNTLFWLTQGEHGQGYICRVGGGSGALTPTIVSPTPINELISRIDDISDCISYAYQDRGHEFIVFTFPSGDKTIVYDVSTQLWHTRSTARETDPPSTTVQGRHIGNCYVFLNGIHYVGAWNSGKIYQLTSTALTDDGVTITRRRRSGHINQENKRLSITRLEIDMTKGAGLISGQGSNPQIHLSVSKDGGNTFVSKPDKGFGAMGAYSTRTQWTMLGSSRDWVFDISVTDPVDHTIISCIADYELGDS